MPPPEKSPEKPLNTLTFVEMVERHGVQALTLPDLRKQIIAAAHVTPQAIAKEIPITVRRFAVRTNADAMHKALQDMRDPEDMKTLAPVQTALDALRKQAGPLAFPGERQFSPLGYAINNDRATQVLAGTTLVAVVSAALTSGYTKVRNFLLTVTGAAFLGTLLSGYLRSDTILENVNDENSQKVLYELLRARGPNLASANIPDGLVLSRAPTGYETPTFVVNNMPIRLERTGGRLVLHVSQAGAQPQRFWLRLPVENARFLDGDAVMSGNNTMRIASSMGTPATQGHFSINFGTAFNEARPNEVFSQFIIPVTNFGLGANPDNALILKTAQDRRIPVGTLDANKNLVIDTRLTPTAIPNPADKPVTKPSEVKKAEEKKIDDKK